jgi:predicted ATPase/DNA-binding winged helix-turn-helix (wHTH) protein
VAAAEASVRYRFGRFELQLDERRLLAAAAPVQLGPHAFDMLVVLAERSGSLVTKDELLRRVWGKVIVAENTLQGYISDLRKVLGADSIATVSGRGYRFTMDVTPICAVPSGPKHNLPHELTSFIGREKEIVDLGQLLGRVRLLTLTGSGGCGKTRLAIQLTTQQVQKYPDGIWLVELAALADPALVPELVATVLGVKEQTGTGMMQTLGEYIGSKRLLLLLDNAEHVLGACAHLVDALLRGCEQLVILVTSRERLGITGEMTYRVPSLALPDTSRGIEPEQIVACESVRLFVERARLQRPHFAVTAENASAVAAICQQLDGIPLAIELAAPRVRSMSVQEVSRRLDQRFSFLTGGSRTAMPRQRRLRSLIDWSYDLLSKGEKVLLNRVSVFAGGWTLEAAEQVCASEGIDRTDVLDLLASLVDKSLIAADERDGATRYGLLETLRHYAREQLRDSGEEAQLQRRHLHFFLALAEDAEPQLKGAEQQVWLDRLEIEHGNLRSALAWSSSSGEDAADGLRLAGAVSWFWFVRGHLAEGYGWLSGLLTAEASELALSARAKALSGAGVLAYVRGDYPAAQALHEECLEIHRQHLDRQGIVQSLNNLGIVAYVQGDYSATRALSEQALAIQRELGDEGRIAILLTNLGMVAFEQGDHPAARTLLEEALAIHRRLGGQGGIAVLLGNLGYLAWARGDYRSARALLEEGVAIGRQLGEATNLAGTLANLAVVAHDQGDYSNAQALLKESLAIHRQAGNQRGIAGSLELLAAVAFALAGADPAARVWGRAERLREEIGAPHPPSELARYQRDVTTARTALHDDAAFDLAWHEGRAMTLEQVMHHALHPEVRPVPG